MRFNLYNAWTDPVFYVYAAIFAASLFFLVYSISKYLEITNKSEFDEGPEGAPEVQAELPLAQAAAAAGPSEEKTLVLPPDQLAAAMAAPAQPAEPPAPAPSPSPPASAEASRDFSKVEEFVKGLYQNMSSLDARMKNIESLLAKGKVNKEFTVTFLEDMLTDFDALSKEKIKARIDYLLSDLKK